MFRMVLFNSTMDTIDNNTMYLSGNYSPVISLWTFIMYTIVCTDFMVQEIKCNQNSEY